MAIKNKFGTGENPKCLNSTCKYLVIYLHNPFIRSE